MNHGKSMLIKALLLFPVIWIVLTGFNQVTFVDATIVAVILYVVAYIGDMLVVRNAGNTIGTIGDLILGTLVIWFTLVLLGYNNVMGEAIAAALILTAGEYFYHKWLINNLFQETEVPSPNV
ncbi:DUF2512 family protein [Jeotgalibacillus salarius]|uniref:DUF2512 family protein n=1 Tax=Jeotgalibacillus salarius TaxID=546023 RepID=A0A4Y8LEA3_9BACL|nr:DUF2512 family protein [Jeotgalibacillus salarius]TFD99818.1 DUF2512 family protein [Jeotgalibacillus salarius]